MSTNNTTDTMTESLISRTQVNGLDNSAVNITGVQIPEPRESLITTAVNFLQNAKVRHTTLMQKQQFLQSKGLTPHEIQLACERAGVFTQDPNKSDTFINMDISSETHSQLALQQQPTSFGRLRELLHSTALISGLAYVLYLFWKKYIEPFIFGTKKKKPISDALEDIGKKVDARINEVNKEVEILKDSITLQHREQAQMLNREFNNFRSDLEAIKGLLLNRKQFASPLTSVTTPSIPAWQLASSPHHIHRHSQSDYNEKADDAGSGSGSSETEVVTKNSDSSLEIM